MDADEILALLRPLVLVLDDAGTVLEWHGAHGGFHGYQAEDALGRSVFDFVEPSQVDELATYFLEAVGRSAETLSLPLPLRLVLIDRDGHPQTADVIPTGHPTADGHRWVVTVVADDLHTLVSRSLEAEMAGASRDVVKRQLTEELQVDNTSYRTRWFLVDLTDADGPAVITSRSEDVPLADALAAAVTGGWRPWDDVPAGEVATVPIDEMPEVVRAAAADRRWMRSFVTPVHVDGRLDAAYLAFGIVPPDHDIGRIDRNVAARIRRLVDTTALLLARWQDRDQLVEAATRDPLTGLANRDALAGALATASTGSTVLYVDVDDFKSINDRYGHDVGDRVLVEVATRIATVCRPGDVVARFGGDEFVVLLDGIGSEAARAVAERMVELVVAPMPELAEIDRVTISVGVGDGVGHADLAMLHAKRTGRGRVVEADRAG